MISHDPNPASVIADVVRTDDPFTGIIRIPLAKNPLSLNKELNRFVKAKLVKQWRTFAALKAARFPDVGQADVTLTWFVKTNHRRDEINMSPLMKALCDGLVDAGVTADDTPQYMSTHCRIERAPAGTEAAYMELKIQSRKATS